MRIVAQAWESDPEGFRDYARQWRAKQEAVVWRFVLLIPLVWWHLLAYGALIVSNSAILSQDGQGLAGAQPLWVTSVRISGLAVHTLVYS